MQFGIRKTYLVGLILLTIVGLAQLTACDKDQNPELFAENESFHGSTGGHHFYENCMECHAQAETGEGWFSIAGSMMDSTFEARATNGWIRLFTEPQGQGDTLIEIEVDAGGYFYTYRDIDLSNGYYAAAYNAAGVARYMDTIAHFGSCNTCHHYNELPIYVDP